MVFSVIGHHAQSLIEFYLKNICGKILPELKIVEIRVHTHLQLYVHAGHTQKDSQFTKEWCNMSDYEVSTSEILV